MVVPAKLSTAIANANEALKNRCGKGDLCTQNDYRGINQHTFTVLALTLTSHAEPQAPILIGVQRKHN